MARVDRQMVERVREIAVRRLEVASYIYGPPEPIGLDEIAPRPKDLAALADLAEVVLGADLTDVFIPDGSGGSYLACCGGYDLKGHDTDCWLVSLRALIKTRD